MPIVGSITTKIFAIELRHFPSNELFSKDFKGPYLLNLLSYNIEMNTIHIVSPKSFGMIDDYQCDRRL